MRLGRQRRRRRRPRQVVLIDTGVPVVALADGLHHVHRQLQRRTDATQKRPTRQPFFQNDHGLVLIWNGVLLTIATINAENRKSSARASRTTWRTAGPS